MTKSCVGDDAGTNAPGSGAVEETYTKISTGVSEALLEQIH